MANANWLGCHEQKFEACDFVLLQTNLSLECPMYGKLSGLSDCLKTILSDVLPLSIIGLPERSGLLLNGLPLTRFCFLLLCSITSMSGNRDVESASPLVCLYTVLRSFESDLINTFWPMSCGRKCCIDRSTASNSRKFMCKVFSCSDQRP